MKKMNVFEDEQNEQVSVKNEDEYEIEIIIQII